MLRGHEPLIHLNSCKHIENESCLKMYPQHADTPTPPSSAPPDSISLVCFHPTPPHPHAAHPQAPVPRSGWEWTCGAAPAWPTCTGSSSRAWSSIWPRRVPPRRAPSCCATRPTPPSASSAGFSAARATSSLWWRSAARVRVKSATLWGCTQVGPPPPPPRSTFVMVGDWLVGPVD